MMDNVQIKLRLEQMRKGVLSRQAKLSRHVERRKEPLPADFAEQAVELENEETIVQLARQMNEELVKLDAALVRLGEDRYTTCVQCSGEIEPGRLVALPTTALCLECAKQA